MTVSRILPLAAVSFVILAGLGFLFASAVGRPMSTDLSLVGKGTPALVLAYENYSPAGADAFDRLSRVRKDYEPRMAFVIADLGVPQGRAFADRHQLFNGQAMFFTADGRPLRTMTIPADEQALRSLLDGKLAAVE